MPKAIVLLSGGLDSATVLQIAKKECDQLYTLSFDYEQRHRVELSFAYALAMKANVLRRFRIDLPLRAIGGSALTDMIDVPKDGIKDGIPVTYVPARNTVFLSYAMGLAEVLKADRIYIGVNALDYSGYPDCRPEFIAAFQRLIDVAVIGRPVSIVAPLLNMTKAQIIQRGTELEVDFSRTSSCYDPLDAGACGLCDSCRIRRAGFEQAGIADPTVYR